MSTHKFSTQKDIILALFLEKTLINQPDESTSRTRVEQRAGADREEKETRGKYEIYHRHRVEHLGGKPTAIHLASM
jgi:hypothetical protein